jgi:antitoxin (DNA-binding transcriptional repressor) of toxin-antitoxin stability system
MGQIANVRTLRNEYARLLASVEAGETITIQRHGKTVALLTPPPAAEPRKVDWTKSAAFKLKRSGRKLDYAAIQDVLDDNKGRY